MSEDEAPLPLEGEPVLSLVADDWFQITGRGDVAAMQFPEVEGLYDPAQMIGWVVRIDDALCEVRGVDRTLGYKPSPGRPYRGTIGLLVRWLEKI